jgi:hypothetical protein
VGIGVVRRLRVPAESLWIAAGNDLSLPYLRWRLRLGDTPGKAFLPDTPDRF